MSEKKRLFLLDAYALIYRAYYAFIRNPRVNSKGLNTSAAFGFTNSLIEVLEKEKPDYIAVVFDTPEETERTVEYSEYKANRESTPEDISNNIPFIREIIQAFNIPILEYPGYEADDIIGTVAQKAAKEGYEVYMMTPDKDFAQLVTDSIFMYKPSSRGNGVEIWGVDKVKEKFEVEDPSQVIDILGMWGDSVDNIPGIPGVGEKTAKKLVGDYGSMEGLYENTDKLKGKLKEKVEANKEQAFMSKRLATIIIDAPVDFNEKSFLKEDPDEEKLKKIFTELEFKRMGERVLGEHIPVGKSTTGQMDMFSGNEDESEDTEKKASGFATMESENPDYHLVESDKDIDKLIKRLDSADAFAFDTETTSLDFMDAEIVGISFAVKKKEAFYVPLSEDKDAATKVLKKFKEVFLKSETLKIGHNLKYDMSILKKYGIEVEGQLFDTMLAHYLIQPDMRHGMDVLAEAYLNYKTVSIESLIGKKGKNQKSMREIEVDKVMPYACEDADITWRLKELFEPKIKEDRLERLFYEIEIPLVKVLADMEAHGVKIDSSALEEFSKRLQVEIEKTEKEIFEISGDEFNISSPKQLGEVLFDKMKIVEKPKKTKSGQYSTSEETLQKLADKHPIIEKILEYRSLNKLKSTYVDALPKLINPNTGRIHTSFNQTVTVTGRLSSNNPNLQNIPIRTERGREVRKAFVATDDNHTVLAADYSQVELRVIAHLSGDENMIQAFKDGKDIHAATASKVFEVPLEKVTSDMRRNAKTVNFGIIYGISAFGLAQRLNISRSEASEIIKQYFTKYAGVKEYMDSQVEKAKKQGYVETLYGRRRYLSDINSGNAIVRGFAERNAINMPIQGTSADMIKIAMHRIFEAFKKEGVQSKMTMQVHDELVFDARKNELDIIQPIIEEKMRDAIKLDVPIEVDMNTGMNWLEAH